MYFLSLDMARVNEMQEASPEETPSVNLAKLMLAAISPLGIPEAVGRDFPYTVTSLPSVPPDPELEQLLPTD